CARVQCSIHDVCPSYQFLQIRRMIAETIAGYAGDELSARAEIGIKQLPAARIAAVMIGIFGAQECALMVVEPPRETRIGRILEIYNRIDVAIEKIRLKQLGCFVREPRKGQFCPWRVLVFEKTAEKRC